MPFKLTLLSRIKTTQQCQPTSPRASRLLRSVIRGSYFRLPEPAGRTFAELDLLFERGVSARKFASTQVDVFDAVTVQETVEGTGTMRAYEQRRSSLLQGEETALPPRSLPREAFS